MNTETLIAELTLKAQPVKRLSVMRICVEWLAVLALSTGIIVSLHGLRPDLAERLSEPLFTGELFFNVLLILAAGCAATAFSYPDRAKAPVLKPMLLVLLSGYSLLMLITILNPPSTLPTNPMHDAPHGIECMLCILSFAAIPALWMFWRLRYLAITAPAFAGGTTLMMAVATGCLGVRLIETETASAGLFLWHYLPLLLLSGVGLWLGRKIFRW